LATLKKTKLPKFSLQISIILFWVHLFGYGQTGIEVISQTIQSTKALKSLHFEMISRERIDDEYKISVAIVKCNLSPYQTYLQSVLDGGGLGPEVLYRSNKNNNQAIISPNKFPYFNIHTDLNSFILRNGHHHTLKQSIFTFIADVMENEFIKIGDENLKEYIVREEDVIFRHWNCYYINIYWADFEWVPYTVKKGETLTTIAEKLVVSDYHILQKNEDVDDYDDVSEGDKILVPNHYAKRVEFFIDKATNLPVYTKISDERGVFAQYQQNWLIVNPNFSELDFSTENPQYNFKF
jgi:hypothetical protein